MEKEIHIGLLDSFVIVLECTSKEGWNKKKPITSIELNCAF